MRWCNAGFKCRCVLTFLQIFESLDCKAGRKKKKLTRWKRVKEALAPVSYSITGFHSVDKYVMLLLFVKRGNPALAILQQQIALHGMLLGTVKEIKGSGEE